MPASVEDQFSTNKEQKIQELKGEKFSYQFLFVIGIIGAGVFFWMISQSGHAFYDNHRFETTALTTEARVDMVYDPDMEMFMNSQGARKSRMLGAYVAEVRYRIDSGERLIKTNIVTRSTETWARVNSPDFFFDYVYADVHFLPDEPRKARFVGDPSYDNMGWNLLAWSILWGTIGFGCLVFAWRGMKPIKQEIAKLEGKAKKKKNKKKDVSNDIPLPAPSNQIPTENIQRSRTGEDEPEI